MHVSIGNVNLVILVHHAWLELDNMMFCAIWSDGRVTEHT